MLTQGFFEPLYTAVFQNDRLQLIHTQHRLIKLVGNVVDIFLYDWLHLLQQLQIFY
ncbi:hypothetical protein D3C76_1786160 [compost metagenome]